jgi:hypothetical protein
MNKSSPEPPERRALKEATMPGQREQAIRERTYAIWQQEGREGGKDLYHWFRVPVLASVSRQSRAQAPIRRPQFFYSVKKEGAPASFGLKTARSKISRRKENQWTRQVIDKFVFIC